MRNLATVIDQMLAQIPQGESLVPVLEGCKSSFLYAAPEMHLFWWQRVAECLEDHIGVPQLQWQQEVADIFTLRKANG